MRAPGANEGTNLEDLPEQARARTVSFAGAMGAECALCSQILRRSAPNLRIDQLAPDLLGVHVVDNHPDNLLSRLARNRY